MECIKTFIVENPFQILFYFVCITVFFIFQLIDKQKKRTQYKIWKRESINIGFYKREYERSEDIFIQQLWDENIRLNNENKFLKKENSKISIVAVLLLLGFFIDLKLRKIFKKST